MMCTNDPESFRVLTAETLAESLNDAGISYVLINGLYGYPAGIGRDLDILVRSEDAPKVIAQCEAVGQQLGWDRLLVRWSPYGTWQLFLIRKDRGRLSWLEVDPMLKDTMVMGAATLLEEWGKTSDLRVDFYRGPFPVSKVGHYVKSQLRPILYGDLERFRLKYALETVDDKDILRYLQSLLGIPMADRYCKATKAGAEGVAGLGGRLKWAINARFALRHPCRGIRNVFWSRIVRPIKLYCFSAGMVFQIVGPEFSSKRRILKGAQEYLNGCFQVRIQDYWDSSKRPQHVSAEERVSWPKHWLRILYETGRRTWKYYFEDRFLPKSVIQFVLYSGGNADIGLDPGKYGFRSTAGLRYIQALIPRPIEVALIPKTYEQCVGDGLNEGIPPSTEQLARWQAWAYNIVSNNVVTATDSEAESGENLALCILRELELRFGASECKRLQREKQEKLDVKQFSR